MYFIETVEQ